MCALSTSTNAPTVSVSWEIAKYLVDDASKGDPQAILVVIKLACPDWQDVKLEEFTVEMLGGGFSGNVPFKCSATGMDGSLAFKIVPPEDDTDEEGGETMCGAAYNLWSSAGVVPKVFLLGNPAAPGIEICEFIEGKSASWLGTKHGAEFLENDEDAASFGKLVGKIHSLPTAWYEPFVNDPKPQWTSWQAGSTTNKMALERRTKYGDYAAMVVLFASNHSHRGKNMEALGKSCIELLPLIIDQLTTDIMKEIRVCHSDLHGGNLLHRKQDGHGDLVAVDLDFVGYNPAVLDLGVALGGTMSGPYGYFFGKGEPMGGYPSLASRRLVAKSYTESLANVKNFSKTDVDDIVFDMEVGGMLRLVWATPIFAILGLNKSPQHFSWALLHFTRAACNIFEQCKTDANLKKQVLEHGVAKIFTDRLLELGMKPCELGIDQYKEHWNIFGSLGPAFSGPFLPDDPEPNAEEKEMVEAKPSDHISSLQAATLRFHESTGADIKSLFKKFDTNNNELIEFQELLSAAAMCGVGFKNLDEAKKAFAVLDSDGDGSVDFDEFKGFLEKAQ